MEIVAIAIIIIFIFIMALIISCQNDTARKKEKEVQDDYIQQSKISVSAEYSYHNNMNDISIRYIVDNWNKKVHISDTNAAFWEIPYSEIIGCEVLTDSEVTGGVGRAIVGAALAGGTGAIVGAATAKKHIMSYKIVIYRENINIPQTVITLVKSKMSTKDSDYTKAVAFASQVNASIKAIISQHYRDTFPDLSSQSPVPKKINDIEPVADEIEKLAQLRDRGLLTDEEFMLGKKQLLESIR